MGNKFFARTDRNHKDIMDAFRKLGAFVHSTHAAGRGFPDLVVGLNSTWHLVEVKDGEKTHGQKGLTEAQEKFFERSKGFGETPYVVETEADVFALVERWRVGREFCECGCPREYHYQHKHECTNCTCDEFQHRRGDL